MDKNVTPGMNRTGLQMAPRSADDMADFAKDFAEEAPPDEGGLMALHRSYIEEADRNGSVPLPARPGNRSEIFIDELGERLAFERAGTRLYEAMILKCAAIKGDTSTGIAAGGTVRTGAKGNGGMAEGGESGEVDLAALKRIHDEEEAHFFMVNRALTALGADPTAMTPCADVAGVMAQGLIQAVSDPSTSVPQSLEAILAAELSDNAGWELLIELADELGHDKMAEEFREALADEQRHLRTVKSWLRSAIMSEAA